jgi:hypothetical protein
MQTSEALPTDPEGIPGLVAAYTAAFWGATLPSGIQLSLAAFPV